MAWCLVKHMKTLPLPLPLLLYEVRLERGGRNWSRAFHFVFVLMQKSVTSHFSQICGKLLTPHVF
jgi:hypothetical protein